jgi:hypothetical protein
MIFSARGRPQRTVAPKLARFDYAESLPWKLWALVTPKIALTLRYEYMRKADIDIHELSREPTDLERKGISVNFGESRYTERGALP